MPLHDYWCQTCGQLNLDVYRSVAVGAQADPPEHCGRPMRWIPFVGFIDAKEPFQRFEVRDGQNRLVTIDSLRKLRQLEATSEQQYRNGEGQPLVFRRYAQDATNKDVHSLHPGWTGGEAPDPAWVKKNAAALKRDMSVADTEYGPGVSDATPSALDHLSKD